MCSLQEAGTRFELRSVRFYLLLQQYVDENEEIVALKSDDCLVIMLGGKGQQFKMTLGEVCLSFPTPPAHTSVLCLCTIFLGCALLLSFLLSRALFFSHTCA